MPATKERTSPLNKTRRWIRTDKGDGSKSYISELDVFAKLHNAMVYEDTYAAMAAAHKLVPLETRFATYYPA